MLRYLPDPEPASELEGLAPPRPNPSRARPASPFVLTPEQRTQLEELGDLLEELDLEQVTALRLDLETLADPEYRYVSLFLADDALAKWFLLSDELGLIDQAYDRISWPEQACPRQSTGVR